MWTLNFGPQHPATHTTFRIVLKLDGERVLDAMPDIGYLHSGFEKLGEHLDYNQYVTITDRMNYVSPMSNNVGWHLAVEKLLGIETPPRCQYIRVIISELSRITDHLLCLGAMGLDTGAFTHFIYAFNPREQIYDICEALCGARLTNSYTRVGGLMCDISPKAIAMIRDFLKPLPKTLADMERLMNRNRIFVNRTARHRPAQPGRGDQPKLLGPGRPGERRDSRSSQGRAVFGLQGFRFQRLLRRGRRLLRPLSGAHGRDAREHQDHPPGDRESARGPVNVGDVGRGRPARIVWMGGTPVSSGGRDACAPDRVNLPDKSKVFSTIEGLITHFELVMTNRGFPTPSEEVYCATEAPNGELGFYIVGDGSERAYRARCRPPSFIHFALFPHLIRGHTLSDIVAVLGSLNIIAAELDR